MSFSFDDISILDSSGHTFVKLARPVGPIEEGSFNGPDNWVPASDPTLVQTAGFAIDPSGNVYFDTVKVGTGDGATLFVDPAGNRVWVEPSP